MDPKVVTREEVDALMQGFDPDPVGPVPGGAGSTTLQPGQRVGLALHLPSAPRRTLPSWRATPRPIESWPAGPRAQAAGAWRPTRRATPAGSGLTDYWPAYADALSNVVLNLLFLVGLLTMGLVVLNQEVIAQQLRLAEERARALLAVQQVRPPPPPPLRREPPPASPAPPAAALPPPEPAPEVQLPVREFAMRRERPAAPGGTAAAPAPAPGFSAEAAAQAVTGGRFVTRLTFDLRETAWPAGRPLFGAEQVQPEDRRALVAFAPADNRRQMSDAFGRLTSVRNQMVANGVAPQRIVLRLAPLPPELEGDELAARTVYVINLERP